MILEKVLEIDNMSNIRDAALSNDHESISLWAQCLLEFESSDEVFLQMVRDNGEDLPWIGELACCLLKVQELCLKKPLESFDKNERGKIEEELLEVLMLLATENSESYLFFIDGTINFNDSDSFQLLNGDNFTATSDSSTVSILRKLAHGNFCGAQYFLAIAGDNEEKWILKASENNYLLANYRLGFALRKAQPEQAIYRLERFLWQASENKDKIDWNILDHLKEEAHGQIVELTAHLTEERTRVEAQKEMLAFLAHTLTNSLAGSADVLRRIAKSLAVTAEDDSAIRQRATERLVGLMTSFSITESLVSSFKLYATDPQSLKISWEKDIDGEVPLKQLIALSVRQAVSRFFFTAEHARDFSRLMPGRDYRELTTDFIENALSFDLDNNDQTEQFFAWLRIKLPFISLHISSSEKTFLTRSGARYILIFSIISEMLTNSLKYTCEKKSIELRCEKVGDRLCIRSKNYVSTESNLPKSGNKGIQFIESICNLIDGKITKPVIENGEFKIEASLPM